MPRKAFLADLKEAQSAAANYSIFDLKVGDEDGTLDFRYKPHGDNSCSVPVTAHLEVGNYPSSHHYLVYTTADHVPKCVNDALSHSNIFDGLTVTSMISKAATIISNASAGFQGDPIDVEDGAVDIDSPTATISDPEEDDFDIYNDGFSDDGDNNYLTQRSAAAQKKFVATSPDAEYVARLHSDVRKLKEAGFRIGHHGDILTQGQSCILILSCRIAKLEIPEDALQAWHLDREQYFLLLIHYSEGYRTLEELSDDPARGRRDVKFRVGMNKRHKVTLHQALDAFSQLTSKDKKRKCSMALDKQPTEGDTISDADSGLQGLFIGRPLDDLLNARLFDLVNYRRSLALRWDGAELFYKDSQGQHVKNADALDGKYWEEETSAFATHLPGLVTADHLSVYSKYPSFPLVAMQFSLRHMVRCTEFCLVCHCKVKADFEALKPYVCSNPLCLYQYMALGFGPSIEHEILTQPHVVDMLISFCYSSAAAMNLKDFPTGLALMVPSVPSSSEHRAAQPLYPTPSQPLLPILRDGKIVRPSSPPTEKYSPKFMARFDPGLSELTLIGETPEKLLHAGDWVYLITPTEKEHRRVVDTFGDKSPKLRLGEALPTPAVRTEPNYMASTAYSRPTTMKHAPTPPPAQTSVYSPNVWPEIEVIRYDQNFDDLLGHQKQRLICMLLSTLPSVPQMREYLLGVGRKHLSLRNWTERISPAALNILRWIIASNRSCIIQIDSIDKYEGPAEDRVLGMKSYMQFRFAQGAPDKEQRFITAVRQTKERLSLDFPTIFAWHGSPLRNWHGIVREGLNFDKAQHGRAYGDGVYHSPNAATSLSYSNNNFGVAYYTDSTSLTWQQSQLGISQALCLNEIVNAPAEFVNQKPHLVVAQVDWIQTRYLFIKCNVELEIPEKAPARILEQHPTIYPRGPANETIVLPITTISKSRRPTIIGMKDSRKHKSRKVAIDAVLEEDRFVSDNSDTEDLEVLFGQKRPVSQTTFAVIPKTKFSPGLLDHKTLPLIKPPAYATSQATTALQKELQTTLKVQATQPAEDLGWYIDPSLVENVYQWIVELHSFDLNLPLAKDMKSRSIDSIVLELRFGKEFPYSPPFVRVIRPQFVPLMAGGGGHITMGGAICMELLTNSGWNPASAIEAVLLQVRMELTSTDPPAKIQNGGDYGISGAIEAYKRACINHGWQIPADFLAISSGAEAGWAPGPAYPRA